MNMTVQNWMNEVSNQFSYSVLQISFRETEDRKTVNVKTNIWDDKLYNAESLGKLLKIKKQGKQLTFVTVFLFWQKRQLFNICNILQHSSAL